MEEENCWGDTCGRDTGDIADDVDDELAIETGATIPTPKYPLLESLNANDVVGKCIECNNPYDEISGANLCTVCRDLILCCPSCHDKLDEFHCERHQTWKNAYFTFLERYTNFNIKKTSYKYCTTRTYHRRSRRMCARLFGSK
jgi:hypothetical protein